MITPRHLTTLTVGLAWLGTGIAIADGFDPVTENRLPEVRDPAFSASEGFQMTLHAAPGIYGIEYSTDLQNWHLHGNLALEAATAVFTDAGSVGQHQRFYRVSGEYDASDYHLINAFLAVESRLGSQGEARNRTGFEAFETVRLGSTGADRVSLTVFDERFSEISNIKGGPGTFGTVRAAAGQSVGEDGTFLADVDSSGFTVQLPALNELNISGLPKTRPAWELPMQSFDDGLTTLAGIGTSPYQISETPDVVEGREINLVLMGRKSRDADPAGMAGAWGLVRWLQKADSDPNFPNYNVGAYAFDINAQTSTFDFSYVREVEVEQNLQGGPPIVRLNHEDGADVFSLPFAVEPDGSIELFDGDFRGFVSSSADFMAATGVNPDLLGGLGSEGAVEQAVADATSQYLVAVRRDVAPQLAGRTYRLMGQGAIVQDGKFEVFALSPDENTLVIAADGESAVETNKIDWFAANFGGGQSQGGDGPFTLDYDMTIDPSGLIRMDGEIFGEDVEYTLFGFAQQGGRVLILSKAIVEGGDNAGDLAVVIAVETEPGPVFGADSGDFNAFQTGTFGIFVDGMLEESVTIQEVRDVDLVWNEETVKTSRMELSKDGELVEYVWKARATDGSVYMLQREAFEPGFAPFEGLVTYNPPVLWYPGSPFIGQSWTNIENDESRQMEVINMNGTSPGGIEGCVVIRETKAGDWHEDQFFKDGRFVGNIWTDLAGSDPQETLYRTGN